MGDNQWKREIVVEVSDGGADSVSAYLGFPAVAGLLAHCGFRLRIFDRSFER